MPLGFSALGSAPVGASGSVSLLQTIPALPGISGVTVIPSTVTIDDGQSQDFEAVTAGTGTYDPTVVWSTPYGNISPTGVLTLPSVGITRIFQIQAKSLADPSKIGWATVTQLANADFIAVAPHRTLKTAAGNYGDRLDYDNEGSGDTYYMAQGVWVIDKDVDESLYYALDVGPEVDSMYTQVASAIALPMGVTLDMNVKVQGTLLVVKVAGGDTGTGYEVINSVTFRVTCTNGEVFDRTIYFVMKDN